MPRPIWVSAGELSGDVHGAELVTALLQKNSSLRYIGMGGEYMEKAGVKTLFRSEALSIMGIAEVLGHLPRIAKMLLQIRAALQREKPQALVVIDSPDFHFWVIKIARALNIPVYYYISPKLWAWRQERARFIKKNVRKLISILPFEVPFYQRFGVEVNYVGNPLVDIVNYDTIKSVTPIAGRIGFLPGSRLREVTSLLPAFGGAARILLERKPDLSFVCFRAPNMKEETLRAYWPSDVPLMILSPENRWSAMRECIMLIAASGTVTLESAIAEVPTIATYKVTPLSYIVGKLLIKVRYMSLPNLIAEKEIFPELIQGACDAEPLAAKALEWLDGPDTSKKLAVVSAGMILVKSLLGGPGAASRAADVLLSDPVFIGKEYGCISTPLYTHQL